MAEFYAEIRLVHIYAVFASGALFLLRGIVLFSGGRWAMAALLRYLSYTIDTVLLTAALMLTTIVEQYPFIHAWLTAKVVLLVVYVALGAVAFWGTCRRAVRTGYWVTALVVFIFIVTIAQTHHPLGILRGIVE